MEICMFSMNNTVAYPIASHPYWAPILLPKNTSNRMGAELGQNILTAV